MYYYFTENKTKKFSNKLSEIQTEKKLPIVFDTSGNITSKEPVIRRPRSNPVTETPFADQAIRRWKEKMTNQSHSKLITINYINYYSLYIYILKLILLKYTI